MAFGVCAAFSPSSDGRSEISIARDQFGDSPIFETAVGQITTDDQGDLFGQQLLLSNRQRVRLSFYWD